MNIIAPLAAVLCSAIALSHSSSVELIDNGYEGLVIAISPAVPENSKLIDAIKVMVTDASAYLFKATNRVAYFKNVSILIPISWRSQSNYARPKYESYGKAEVRIAALDEPDDDSPYTHQYGLCGDPGQYIQFTPNFLLDDKNLDAYGPRGRALVHEWGHLRWGLFDEYNQDEPFYLHGNRAEFTRCSSSITGGTGVVSCNSAGWCSVRDCKTESSGLPEKDCVFFPDNIQNARESIMAMQWLDKVSDFCTANSHNRNAPTPQNRLCGSRSAWEIMQRHKDFHDNQPLGNVPPQPTFSLLRASHRVTALVLDKSGSMSGELRLPRLLQAAEIFIMQILNEGESVGIVMFDSAAQARCELTKISDTASRESLKSCLPTSASGGTNICAGLLAGFQVLSADDGTASGDEIILMTDGEDSGISSCFDAARDSGCTIHTIALGPSAAPELETLAELTGGLKFSASDSLDTNALVDAFTSMTTESGDSDALVIQLESTGKVLNKNEWMDGDVSIDASIGNNTQFVVTWQSGVPDMHITDPNSVSYSNANFTIDTSFKSARLTIPGRATAGTWKYRLLNNAGIMDTFTLTVTSMASSKGVPPITVEAHVQSSSSSTLSAMTIYAEVQRGTTPVVGANVTALIERPGGATLVIELLDNGANADIRKDDGVYSRYFTQFTATGRYSLKVRVAGSKGTTRLAPRRGSKAIFISGFRNEKGELEVTQVPAPAGGQVLVPSEDISRVASGGSFQATVPPGGPVDIYPPCRVLDLKAQLQGSGIISLTWTAPGDDADFGQASEYEIMVSDSIERLVNGSDGVLVPHGSVILGNTSEPSTAGSTETFTIATAELKPGESLYFSVRAIDKTNNAAENSNVASVTFVTQPLSGGPVTVTKPARTVHFVISIITVTALLFLTA